MVPAGAAKRSRIFFSFPRAKHVSGVDELQARLAEALGGRILSLMVQVAMSDRVVFVRLRLYWYVRRHA